MMRLPARLPPAAVLALGRAARLAIDFGSNLVMMRMLGPEPFGLVAMTSAVMAAFAAVGDAGVGSSLVSDKDAGPSRVGAAVMTAVGLGLATMVVAICLSPLAAYFYSDDRLLGIGLAMAIALGITPLSSVPGSLAQRDERFSVMATVPVVSTALASVLGIAMAYVQHDYWAILARQIAIVALQVVGFWIIVRPRMQKPSRADLREVFRFGRGVLGFDLLNVFSRNADKVVIGRYLGESVLGLYSLAYRVLTLPLTQIGSIAGTLAYPRLSKIAAGGGKVGVEMGRVMGAVGTICAPICIGAAIAAPELIGVLFGAQWLGAVGPFRVLSLLGVYQAPFALVWLAYKVGRNTGGMARWALISMPPTVASFFIGLPWGALGVSISYASMSLALAVPLTISAARALGTPASEIAAPAVAGVLRGVLLSVPLVLAYVAAHFFQLPPVAVLGAVGIIGALGELWIIRSLLATNASLGTAPPVTLP